jgi:toxin FitB
MSLYYQLEGYRPGDKTRLLQNLTVMRQARVVFVDEQIALNAAQLSITHKLPMADSILLATAQVYNATLWTQDVHFAGIDGVQYVAKP